MDKKNKESVTENNVKRIDMLVAATNMASLNNILHLISDQPDINVVATALDGEELLIKIDENEVSTVVVELALPKISGVKVAEYLSLEKPGIATIILADQSNLGFYRSAMLAGAREFLITPIPGDEFAFSIRRVYELEAERRRKRREVGGHPGVTLTGHIRNKNGKILVFHGGKGGTGRSFIAANISSMLSKKNTDVDVAIADFDLQFGDLSAIYCAPATKNLTDLVAVIDELSLATLKSVATKVSDNLDLFASPPQLEKSELITSDHAVRIIDAFRKNYDLTVINTGALVTEIHIDFLEKADLTALVVNPDVLSIKTCSQIKSLYDKLGFDKNQIGFIFNKEIRSTTLNVKRVRDTLKMDMLGAIPFLPDEVGTLLNEGKLVFEDGSTQMKIAFENLLKNIMEKTGIKEFVPV